MAWHGDPGSELLFAEAPRIPARSRETSDHPFDGWLREGWLKKGYALRKRMEAALLKQRRGADGGRWKDNGNAERKLGGKAEGMPH